MTKSIALIFGLVGEFVVQRLVDDGLSVINYDLYLPVWIKNNSDINCIEESIEVYIRSLEGDEIIINMLPGRIGHGVCKPLILGGHNKHC